MTTSKTRKLEELKTMLADLYRWFPNCKEEFKGRGSMNIYWLEMIEKIVEILDEPT